MTHSGSEPPEQPGSATPPAGDDWGPGQSEVPGIPGPVPQPSAPGDVPGPAGVPGPPGAPGVPGAPGAAAGAVPATPQAAGQADWAWVRPQVPMQTIETEPLEYHRLLRGMANYRWWKPLLLLVLSGVYFGVFTIVVSVAFIPLFLTVPDYMNDLLAGEAAAIDTQVPVSVLLAMVSIIVMIPSVILAMLTLGIRPNGRIWSVAGRIRWGLLGRLLLVALVAVVIMNLAGLGLELVMDPSALNAPADAVAASDFNWTAAWTSFVIILLLVPLQATAEEVVFRGLFMQVLGSWLKSPWFGIVIPSLGFALAHIYDIWGLLMVGVLGLVAAWLTWRTGGLEAAIAIHIVNNLIAFGFMTFNVGGETAQVEASGGPGSLIGALVGYAVFVWLVIRVFRKHGYGRTRIDVLEVPVTVQYGAPGQGGPQAPSDPQVPTDPQGGVDPRGPQAHG